MSVSWEAHEGLRLQTQPSKKSYTAQWKKKFEEGPKRSSSPAGERPKNDGVWKKGTCKKGKDCKFKHPKSSAPAEKGEEEKEEEGKGCPGDTDDAETERAAATPRAKLYYPKKGGEEDKERGFPGLGRVR